VDSTIVTKALVAYKAVVLTILKRQPVSYSLWAR